jgi:hypothetical protein
MKKDIIKPTYQEIMPVYKELFNRNKIKEFLQKTNVKLYWRLLTPLIILWGFIIQRLSSDHTCDEVVDHFRRGEADTIDPHDKNKVPLSKRLKSESTSAYVQGRERLPLTILVEAKKYISKVIGTWLPGNEKATWKGLAVRLIDGTTYRLPPHGDIVEVYGQSSNQYGPGYWVTVRSVAAFCLYTQGVVSNVEKPTSVSEKAMVREVMEGDEIEGSLYVGDQGFGVYRTVQVSRACNKKVLLRVEKKIAKALQKRNGKKYLNPGEQTRLFWQPVEQNVVEPELPTEAIEGRLIFARLEKKGFRPIDIYLFTTLLDEELYSAEELVELYGHRLQVEINYRHIKTTLEMEEFNIQSVCMFQKELAAGLLTYNLICGFMVKASLIAGLLPSKLSFKRCWRRIRNVFLKGIPLLVYEENLLETYLLERLAKCKLPHQPDKVRYEPRKVRRRPAIFPNLKGDRNVARQELLEQYTNS